MICHYKTHIHQTPPRWSRSPLRWHVCVDVLNVTYDSFLKVLTKAAVKIYLIFDELKEIFELFLPTY